MQKYLKFAMPYLLSLLLFITGCAHYPLDMSEAEWNRLSPAQQLEARKEQAILDEERAARQEATRLEREKREAEERQRQLETDIANGLVRQFSVICIGGSKCPGGEVKSHIFSLGQFAFVDKITFDAHDGIGRKHGATIAIYADNHLVVDNMDIKRNRHSHEIFVGAVARNFIFKVRNDDEVQIDNLKVFGQLLDTDNTRILIRNRTQSGDVNE